MRNGLMFVGTMPHQSTAISECIDELVECAAVQE
jgi:hypothetical protein